MTISNLGDLLCSKDSESKKIIFFDGVQHHSVTHAQLDHRANHVAAGLRGQDINVGDRVAIVASNGPAFIACYLGILKLGAVAVLIDPQSPPDLLKQLLDDSAAKFIFSDRDINTAIPLVNLHKDLQNFLIPQSIESFCPSPTDLALFLYTSGSTGLPKGVTITHQNHLARIQYRLPHAQTCMVTTPYCHMNGLFQMQRALAAGCDLVVMSEFQAKNCLQLIDQFGVNLITGVPSIMALLTKQLSVTPNWNVSSITRIISSSAPISRNLYDTVKKTFANAKIFIGYGSTEAGPGIFIEHPTLPTPEMSVGYPNPNIEYRLVDQVLHVRSPYMMTNHNNHNKAFTLDGYFITKDLFSVDSQGFYYFLGRADDMFVCGGQNIYPRHLESILETHENVIQSAVIGLADQVKGVKPYAFVTVKNDCQLGSSQLEIYMQSKLPANQCPRKIWIVDALPMTGTNKVNKNDLEQQAHKLLA
jgi:acyl-CoA synthetase (AMP-forming)/AMP-acid ligase II